MSYSKEQLDSLIADVEKEFSTHLAKAEKSFGLTKSEEEAPKKDEPKDKSKPENKVEEEKPEDKGAKDQHQDAPKDDKAPPMESKEEPKEGDKQEEKPSEAPQSGEDHGYDDEDMQHMDAMYSSMSKPELKAHHDCIRKCMDSMGLAKCEDAMIKSEKDVVVEIPQEVSLLKSELEAAKAESEATKKNLEAVESFLKKFVEKTAPAGKAITSLDIIAKTESVNNEKALTKSEIDAKLLAKSKDSSTSVSDRNAINSYYFSKNVETIRHLLT